MTNDRFIFWMVWREGSPTTNHRHQSKSLALREAERLSRSNPGQVFYVLKTTAAVISEPQPVRRLELVADEIPF